MPVKPDSTSTEPVWLCGWKTRYWKLSWQPLIKALNAQYEKSSGAGRFSLVNGRA